MLDCTCRPSTLGDCTRRRLMTRPLFRRVVLAGVAAAVAGGSLGARPQDQAQPAQRPSPSPASQHGAVVSRYCVTCHNDRVKAGGMTFDGVDVSKVAANPELWEKAVRKLRAGMMPPAGAPRPDVATTQVLVGWLEGELDRAATAHPNPGRPLLHRLNRAEYRNAIRDLIGLEVGDIAALLPPDDSAAGFDNNADVLGISPALLGSYLNAAGEISALAVGDPSTTSAARATATARTCRRTSTSKGSRLERSAESRAARVSARRRVQLRATAVSAERRCRSRARGRARGRVHRGRQARASRSDWRSGGISSPSFPRSCPTAMAA